MVLVAQARLAASAAAGQVDRGVRPQLGTVRKAFTTTMAKNATAMCNQRNPASSLMLELDAFRRPSERSGSRASVRPSAQQTFAET